MTVFDAPDVMQQAGGHRGASQAVATKRAAPAPDHGLAEPAIKPLSPIIVAGLVRAAECLGVLLIGLGVHGLYIGSEALDGYYVAATIGVAVLTVLTFQTLGLYELATIRRPMPQILKVIGGVILVFQMALVAIFFLKVGETYSRVWLLAFFVSASGGLLLGRVFLIIHVGRLAESGRFDRRTAIVGGGEAGEAFLRALKAEPYHGINICGVFDDRDDERSPLEVGGYRKLGNVDALVEFARRTKVDLIVFTLPISAEARILEMLRKLWVLPSDIRLSAHASRLRLRPRAYSYLGSVPMLDVFDRPIADWDVVLKWLFDKLVGSVMLALLLPVFALVALAIKLDSKGPVLFRQKRYGFNNDLIEVFKFRSMYVDQGDATAAKLVTKDDPRVTRVGRFIRKTSLDELPQLFNVVFKGNLSLVGPRPHAVHAKAESRLYDQVVDGYFARHKVKPGITGWAQINGWRGETDTEEKIQRRVEHDLYYIENWSILFDVYILLATPVTLVMSSENAY